MTPSTVFQAIGAAGLTALSLATFAAGYCFASIRNGEKNLAEYERGLEDGRVIGFEYGQSVGRDKERQERRAREEAWSRRMHARIMGRIHHPLEHPVEYASVESLLGRVVEAES